MSTVPPVEEPVLEQPPGRMLWPMERSLHRHKFLTGAVTRQGTHAVEVCFYSAVLLHSMERTHAGAVCEKLQALKRSRVKKSHEEWTPMGGIPRWHRARA